MKSLSESLFDKDLAEKKVVEQIRMEYREAFIDLFKKYGVEVNDSVYWNPRTCCVSLIIRHNNTGDALTKLYPYAINYGSETYDTWLYIRIEMVLDTDNWSIPKPELWVSPILNKSIPGQVERKYTSWDYIESIPELLHVKYDNDSDKRFYDFLKKIENVIKKFNSPSFQNKATDIILNYMPVPKNKIIKLVSEL